MKDRKKDPDSGTWLISYTTPAKCSQRGARRAATQEADTLRGGSWKD